ncbi:MAG: malate dehydrogenase (quinone) [Gallionellaceae bacterium]|jgi:malate dehydrogenase (quinone)
MQKNKIDILLVGAGVMSATLGMLLSRLDPSLKIMMVERLGKVAHESTHSLNNAGTGHAGYCELNYTPQLTNGSVEIKKALAINAGFEVSLQFWSWLVEQHVLPASHEFINSIPHQSFVWGDRDVDFLRKRYEALHQHHLFEEMEYSEDPAVLQRWMPLVMSHRDPKQKIAATQVKLGSDIDFGALTRHLIKALKKQPNFELLLGHSIENLKQLDNGHWKVGIRDRHTESTHYWEAGFVFLGAGGGALPLLQKAGLPESKGYGGFPVSGQWLVCKNPELVKRHHTKVYGRAPSGSPPMSVPHLDARIIDGEPALIFGPYAGFTTKFLREGSIFDLFGSVKPGNLKPMLAVAFDNMDLTRYLVKGALQSHRDRMTALLNFYAEAKENEWSLESAGHRVQIIKSCATKGGKLEFGTETITSKDGTLAALLGASPGASISVQAMIEVIERCFKKQIKSAEWKHRMKEMIPSYGESLDENVDLLHSVRQRTRTTLGLDQSNSKRKQVSEI